MSANRILIVEDNDMNRELFTEVLEMHAYEVHAVDSAELALKRVPELNPSLIVMDIAMPKLDGLTALRMLKANPATANIPVMVVSGHAWPADAMAAKEAGCALYMTKPIDTRQFLRAVEEILEQAMCTALTLES